MMEEALERPEIKQDARPLTEADKKPFFPYLDEKSTQLPSEQQSYKSDPRAVAFLKAIERGENAADFNVEGVNFKGANFSKCNLTGVNFKKTNLTGVQFIDTDLTGACLDYAYLESVNFTGADLTNIHVKGVFFKKCIMDGADIEEETYAYLQTIEWLVGEIEAGKIELKELTHDTLHILDLRMMDLSNVSMDDVDLTGILLDGVNMSGGYINKRDKMNFAYMTSMRNLMEKWENMRAINETQADEKVQQIRTNRTEKLKAYGNTETQNPQIPFDYNGIEVRPRMKNGAIPPTSLAVKTDNPTTDTTIQTQLQKTFHTPTIKKRAPVKNQVKSEKAILPNQVIKPIVIRSTGTTASESPPPVNPLNKRA